MCLQHLSKVRGDSRYGCDIVRGYTEQKGDAVKLKQLAKLALAASPLVLGIATPASGCLCTPNDGQATKKSDQIEDGPECSGPTAPFEKLQKADARNANDKGFVCDPMCKTGKNPTDENQ